ncbi:adenosylcobinamide-GDP ribazoletransferase [Serpentinicella alkaliphila]|uniref:Adenosylcobinamide-GDP ribazoletransferase n=1 Tax=Serpentinicella alkaliphila TaxID=1734049 RepID=A0A4R2TL79_9FIRM|nr:adenosylcobinamide-GDP ribazoletransferase [Serpentinicella alkaliphila]QUH24435.1 adenosylcobinamide-GDP ribazoletransferase [Serpentinicella alkaliphila]TCQ04171.1 cobalamin-5'-phosphate synthase [Serpentinicella alkaliphila]
MKIFILMVQFLTRIPINLELSVSKEDFPKGVAYFPIVGLIIGIINALVYFLLSKVAQEMVPLIAIVISNALVTGALHLDGLADSCDALFSARKKDRMLEIMRDSRIGTNGVLALILTILLKIALLDITPKSIIIPTIILIPVIGRATMSIILYGSTYAREEGLGDLFIGKTSLNRAGVSIIITIFLVFVVLNLIGIIALLVSIIVAYLLRHYFNSKLGGLTGDLLGAVNEVVELIFSFVIVVLWGYIG